MTADDDISDLVDDTCQFEYSRFGASESPGHVHSVRHHVPGISDEKCFADICLGEP